MWVCELLSVDTSTFTIQKRSQDDSVNLKKLMYISDDETDFGTVISDVICVLAWFALTQITICSNQEQ